MPMLRVNGTELYYEDTGGRGPTILFSHGLLWDTSLFAPQIAALKSRYRCVAYDLDQREGDTLGSERRGQLEAEYDLRKTGPERQEQVGHHPANVVKERIERGIPQPQGAERWLEEGPRYFEPGESVGSGRRHGATFGAVQHYEFGAQHCSCKMERQELREIK